MRSQRLRRSLPRLFRQLRVLVIGCGDVGLRVLASHGNKVRLIGTARRPEQCQLIRAQGGRALTVDLDDARSRRRLAGLAKRVIYLAPPDTAGKTDQRLRGVLAQLDRRAIAAPLHLAYCGTTGVYGDASGRLLTEASPINPQSVRGIRRADAERQLRQAVRATRSGPLIVSPLRAPGIYAQERLPLRRLHAGLPVLEAAFDSYSNHIHADDLARALWTAMLRGANSRVINACDGQQILMGDYFDNIAKHFDLPLPRRLSPEQARAEVTPIMWSFMRESRRLSNQRLRCELRVSLQYPTVAVTLAATPRHLGALPAAGKT